MNRDDIIEMAREAMVAIWHKDLKRWVVEPGLERFAALVAAAEREACAQIAESKRHAPNFTLTSMPPQNGTAVDIANAIRARGDSEVA